MTHLDKQIFLINRFRATVEGFLIIAIAASCHGQSPKDTAKRVDTNPKVAPESLHFTAHIIEHHDDGSKAEIDTTTGYRKYFYENGKMQMEGKVTKASPKDYRDGIWSYYNERGQLMTQETYNKEGKVTQLELMYFINGKPLSSTYQYYEGDYKDKKKFKFHKIEKLFYDNGNEEAERHWVNGELVDAKSWDLKGNPR